MKRALYWIHVGLMAALGGVLPSLGLTLTTPGFWIVMVMASAIAFINYLAGFEKGIS